MGIGGALGVVAMLVVVLAPLQRSTSAVVNSDGEVVTSSESQSLLATQGAAIVVVAAVPVVVALLPLVAAWLRKPRLFRATLVGSTVLLGLFVLATGFSIGLLYVPMLLALIVATARGA